jgi:hypothetical protein
MTAKNCSSLTLFNAMTRPQVCQRKTNKIVNVGKTSAFSVGSAPFAAPPNRQIQGEQEYDTNSRDQCAISGDEQFERNHGTFVLAFGTEGAGVFCVSLTR